MAKFCSSCGNKLEDGASFCSKCGAKTGETKSTTTYNPGQKSKIAAGLFGIFFGSLGVHNFYLGYNSKGLAQLLISVLSCFLLSPISAIWGLIEGILILGGEINVDANGVELSD